MEKEYILIKKNEIITNDEVNNTHLSLADVEKLHIKHVLESVKWDKQVASKILGIAKTTLYNKIEAYGLVEKR